MSSPDFYFSPGHESGGYHSTAQHTTVYRDANPEQVFEALVLSHGGPECWLLDVGCADGRNVLGLAPAFQTVYAIDRSAERLALARQHQQAGGVANVIFEQQDAAQMRYANESFDLVSSRRGPTFVAEYRRVLKANGHFIYLGIGEQDAREIKQVFGHGQPYGEWQVPIVQVMQHQLIQEGFRVLSADEFWFDEYYHSPEDLSSCLQLVPMLEDFSPEQDAAGLTQYIAQAQTDQGIRLPRHRILLYAQRLIA